MFENLTENLHRTFKNLRGQGKLTEEHLDVALGEIREALLEGDVNVGVADELLANIRKQALGSEVMLQLSPDQQVVKVVRDELAAMLGKHAKPLFASRPPSVWMIVGLQGSGKTTTTGKLAKWLAERGRPPLAGFSHTCPPARGGRRGRGAPRGGPRGLGAEPTRTSQWRLCAGPLKRRSFRPAT